jgi:hypothetical protein
MNRISSKIIGAALIVFTLGGAALAQGTMAQQDACRPDVFRLCGSYIPDVSQIVACLHGNEARLSEACHQAMFAEPAVSEDMRCDPEPVRTRSETARTTS